MWFMKLKIHFISINNKKNPKNKGLWLSRRLVSCELAPGSRAGECWSGYLQWAELVTVHCTDRREVGCWAPGYLHRVWLVIVFCTTRGRGLLSCWCASGSWAGEHWQLCLERASLGEKTSFWTKHICWCENNIIKLKTLWHHSLHSILFKMCFSRRENAILVKTQWPVWQAHHSTSAPLTTLAAFQLSAAWLHGAIPQVSYFLLALQAGQQTTPALLPGASRCSSALSSPVPWS